eukprot:CAMPEP_0116019310 /NCGR_PEP_ID=MMETSP0321-20121206/9164_1 /TAXON_ID=163516 /ORGANISM="Leptocylindrus danicus var. danicus, Strain B650" /LENGTH=151 /DNA_ID=CAMNT_0003489863 /DNA_START=88 /DNA_END=540 /DNA_ORIENTATION=+
MKLIAGSWSSMLQLLLFCCWLLAALTSAQKIEASTVAPHYNEEVKIHHPTLSATTTNDDNNNDTTGNIANRPLRGSISPTDPLKVLGFDNKQIARVHRARSQAEKDEIVNELMELRSRNMEIFRDMSPEERRVHRDRMQKEGISAPHSIEW